jgi:Cu(I)/Ag(I) efflux system membrane protein CusA/SilA
MIERIIAFSIRYRYAAAALGLVFGLAGLFSALRTPMDAIPDLSETQIIVFTDWPGSSPAEIEAQVTYPLSLKLSGMDHVRVVRTSSDFGFSMIHVIFDDDADLTAARREIGERLAMAQADLPDGVTPTLAADAPATGQIFWYTLDGPGRDLGELRAIHDWRVKPQLASVAGVAEVASVGGYTLEYQVSVDPWMLAARGLTVDSLRREIASSNVSLGGHAWHTPTAEQLVAGEGWIGQSGGEQSDHSQALADLKNVVVPLAAPEAGQAPAGSIRLGELADISLAPGYRRGVLEVDGNEAVGGVVMMGYGENALEVTRRLVERIQEIERGLPSGVRITPGYDRRPLILGAIGTVRGAVVEAMITAIICVLVVMRHMRASFAIAVTLPLSTLGAFVFMAGLRGLGIADVQTNIMSLAGLAISVGVLVDSSIVMTENVMHRLRERFGDRPVHGDIRPIVASACATVGRPIFFSVLIMLLSFLPVFSLSGIEGRMFFPLACTKSFALATAALLSITFTPALCSLLIRGRMRDERSSFIVRSIMDVYRPMLTWLLDRPLAVVLIMGGTLVIGFAAAPLRWLYLAAIAATAIAIAAAARSWWSFSLSLAGLLVAAAGLTVFVKPLEREFLTPLDEGVAMDMPITIPRASVSQAADDLKARDMMLCRFPEVDMVMGKAGRAETPSDPAPIDMIETMVSFRPREFWPRRELRTADAERLARRVWDAMVAAGLVKEAPRDQARSLLADCLSSIMPTFDAQMREYAYHRNREHRKALGPALLRVAVREATIQAGVQEELSPADIEAIAAQLPNDWGLRLAQSPGEIDCAMIGAAVAAKIEGGDQSQKVAATAENAVRQALGLTRVTSAQRIAKRATSVWRRSWAEHTRRLDDELADRAAGVFARLAIEDLLTRAQSRDADLVTAVRRRRAQGQAATAGAVSHHGRTEAVLPEIDPIPQVDTLHSTLHADFARRVMLWRKEKSELSGFGGEMDRVLQMPGWTNVWTGPIQNRVDMLSTGVNTTVGIAVLGENYDDVVKASEQIAAAAAEIEGAEQVVADPVRGKGYLSIQIDRKRAAQLEVRVQDIADVIQAALGGTQAATTIEGRARHPIRVRFPSAWRDDLDKLRRLPVKTLARDIQHRDSQDEAGDATLAMLDGFVPLGEVARIEITTGPAVIRGENGLLRNYVRLNVAGRDAAEFVEEARRRIAAEVDLPSGVHLAWTGQFEHQERARRSLLLAVPVVVLLILGLLYATYRDWADAMLVLLAVPGAVAGGLFVQWLFGYKFSATVAIGYIACFGMATATGVIMLVYLREAIARRGGLARMTLPQLREAMVDGAVQRLRPKLLTEATTIIGLAPLLWADGVGAEVIRPMAAPVLGGILVADEVIDLFLPAMFYWVRRRRWRRLHGIEPAEEQPSAIDPARQAESPALAAR